MIAYTAQTKDPTWDSALIDEQHAEYRWVGYALVCIGSFFSRFFITLVRCFFFLPGSKSKAGDWIVRS